MSQEIQDYSEEEALALGADLMVSGLSPEEEAQCLAAALVEVQRQKEAA